MAAFCIGFFGKTERIFRSKRNLPTIRFFRMDPADHIGKQGGGELLGLPPAAGQQDDQFRRHGSGQPAERGGIGRIFRKDRHRNRGVPAGERIDESCVTLDRMPGRHVEAPAVAEPGRRFARTGEADHRAAFGRGRKDRAAGQPLEVDDQVVAIPADLPHKVQELRDQGRQLAEPFPVEENPARNRERAVIEDFRKRRMHEVIELRSREITVQQLQRGENMQDVSQAARLDHQNAFYRFFHLNRGFIRASGSSCRWRGAAQGVRAARRRGSSAAGSQCRTAAGSA